MTSDDFWKHFIKIIELKKYLLPFSVENLKNMHFVTEIFGQTA